MKKIDLGQTIAILANVGVITGIVFLAIEISQNTAMIEAQMSQDRAETAMSLAQSLYNSDYLPPILAAIDEGRELSIVEQRRFGDYIRAVHRLQDNLLRQSREGLLDTEVEESIRLTVQVEVASREIARDNWERQKLAYSSDYVALVDAVISDYMASR
jgi:hypothetical protein